MRTAVMTMERIWPRKTNPGRLESAGVSIEYSRVLLSPIPALTRGQQYLSEGVDRPQQEIDC